MTAVDVMAVLPAPAPAPNAARKTASDGFARELEAASRPDPRGDRNRAHKSDSSKRYAMGEANHAATKATRPHENGVEVARADGPNEHADHDEKPGTKDAAAEATDAASTAAKSGKDKAAKHETKKTDASDQRSSPAADAAAAATAGTAVVTTTDPVGPGNASSGEASQDPMVTPKTNTAKTTAVAKVAAQAPANAASAKTTDAQAKAAGTADATAASAPQAGAVATGKGSASASGSSASGPSKAASKAAAPSVAGAQASATATAATAAAANAGRADARAPGGEQHRNAEAAPVAAASATSGPVQATPAGVSAHDAAATVAPASQASATHAAPTTDASTQVAAPPTPASAPTQAAAPAAPNQPAFPVPLSSQLSGQLTSLRQMPQGDHVLTLTVNPETFGPVKVVAHITHDGVSLQLFGASDQARAALRAALPDLRRDLAGTGLQPNLELGSDSGSGAAGRDAMGDPSSFAGNGGPPRQTPRPPIAGGLAASVPTVNHAIHATRRGGLDLVL